MDQGIFGEESLSDTKCSLATVLCSQSGYIIVFDILKYLGKKFENQEVKEFFKNQAVLTFASKYRKKHNGDYTLYQKKLTGIFSTSEPRLPSQVNQTHEAIMLDPEGYVAEGSAENFFVVRNGTIYTPDLTSCLDGITRDTVFKLAADFGIQVHEKRISRDEVYISDEAFFSGTAAEIVPIREYDSRIIGSGARGPITAKLQSAYFDLVRGKNADYTQWLTAVGD